MKSKIMFLMVLFAFAYPALAKAEEPISLSYFQNDLKTGYVYERLSPVNTGDERDRYVTYIDSDKIDGELVGLFETIKYLGPMKVKSNDLYAFVDSKVYHSFTFNELTGKHVFFNRPTILIVPKPGKVESWENNNNGDIVKCKSRLVNSVKTSMKTFNNVVLVEREFKNNSKTVKYKEFYAKGYGLVKTEVSIDGNVRGMTSSDLVKIE